MIISSKLLQQIKLTRVSNQSETFAKEQVQAFVSVSTKKNGDLAHVEIGFKVGSAQNDERVLVMVITLNQKKTFLGLVRHTDINIDCSRRLIATQMSPFCFKALGIF